MNRAMQVEEPGERPPVVSHEHKIVLCCAQSVQAMVGEVSRNLQGLGFRAEVVFGAKARQALLGRERAAVADPTVYVVCVQGALKQAVLGPLRQALATHGGPNEHLFVAVLDLALPLAMVGQIRRFAEALERAPGGSRSDSRSPLGERRQWREHVHRRPLERVQTRTYRALKVVDHKLPRIVASTRSPQRRGPTQVHGTQKYRAVTGPPAPAVRSSRRKARNPRQRRVRAPPVRRAIGSGSGSAAQILGDADVRPAPAPQFERYAAPSRSAWTWLLAATVVLGGAASGAYGMGWLDPLLEDVPSAPAEDPLAAFTPSGLPDPVEAQLEPKPAVEAEPEPQSEPQSEPEPEPEPEPELSGEAEIAQAMEQGLAEALRRRKIRSSDAYWVSHEQPDATTWDSAKKLCSEYLVDDIGGWRLPYRRELKLLGAIGLLGPGKFWSRTNDAADRGSAIVYDGTSRTLMPWLKTNDAAVVCIRSKQAR